MKTLKTKSTTAREATSEPTQVDLERYVPAFFTWIANKLSRGASQHYLNTFDVGIETWRCLVLLAISDSITAQQISRVLGMDKGSVSRCLKTMQERSLIRLELDQTDGRIRIAVLTQEGRDLHNQMIGMALDRERAFLSVLNECEVDVLIGLLRRLHENLPAVELASQEYASLKFPKKSGSRKKSTKENED
jgi:DNA-binding MarR family transcriptional regulator